MRGPLTPAMPRAPHEGAALSYPAVRPLLLPLAWLDPGAFGTLGVGAGFAVTELGHRPRRLRLAARCWANVRPSSRQSQALV